MDRPPLGLPPEEHGTASAFGGGARGGLAGDRAGGSFGSAACFAPIRLCSALVKLHWFHTCLKGANHFVPGS